MNFKEYLREAGIPKFSAAQLKKFNAEVQKYVKSPLVKRIIKDYELKKIKLGKPEEGITDLLNLEHTSPELRGMGIKFFLYEDEDELWVNYEGMGGGGNDPAYVLKKKDWVEYNFPERVEDEEEEDDESYNWDEKEIKKAQAEMKKIVTKIKPLMKEYDFKKTKTESDDEERVRNLGTYKDSFGQFFTFFVQFWNDDDSDYKLRVYISNGNNGDTGPAKEMLDPDTWNSWFSE